MSKSLSLTNASTAFTRSCIFFGFTTLVVFFVIFSSIGGFISTSLYGNMLYYEGAIIGIGSLIGVYFGIKIKEKTKSTSYKKFVLLLNLFVLATMIYKTVEF